MITSRAEHMHIQGERAFGGRLGGRTRPARRRRRAANLPRRQQARGRVLRLASRARPGGRQRAAECLPRMPLMAM